MKKLVVVLFLIIVLGGVVFYFGWIQLQLPENTYAVIFTKTGGWDEQVTSPGVFNWRWERLLPTNFRMHTFALQPNTARISAKGMLPSGIDYAGALDPPPDFGFALDLSVDFGIKPESLPNLVATSLLTEDTYDAWLADAAELLSSTSSEYIREQSTRAGFAGELTSMGRGLTEALTTHLSTNLPYLDIKGLTIRNVKAPDFELYILAKELYTDLARKRKESYEAALAEISWTESRSTQHFNVIERYGELITKYPALLNLFELKEGELGSILDDIDTIAPSVEIP